MPRNPFRDESQQHEAYKGDDIVNTRTQKIVRIQNQNGNIQESVVGVRDSMPDQNGAYVDTEMINIMTDRAGNPLPQDPRSLQISHSGLYIRFPEQMATCNSWLHSTNRSKTILIGQDGRLTPQGAVCSHCNFWLNTIYIALAILGIGATYGIYKALSFF
jgi:hypothetical protein